MQARARFPLDQVETNGQDPGGGKFRTAYIAIGTPRYNAAGAKLIARLEERIPNF
ncbi:MAG TPA: hypothetical protein VIJ35_30625 [Bradyrhizobium sp.]